MIRKKIALFASGTGSNALNIMDYFKNSPEIEVAFVLSNKATAPIIEKAMEKGAQVIVCSNLDVETSGFLVGLCNKHEISFIILAGFLRKIPSDLIAAYPERIINVHPSLLPKYGGQGMYGKHVHEAVLANRERESGISIHLVNEEFDRGRIIAQFSCKLEENESLESLQAKIHGLEMKNFPKTIADYITLNT